MAILNFRVRLLAPKNLAIALIVVGSLIVILISIYLLRPSCVISYDKEKDTATISFHPPGEASEETLTIYGAKRSGLYHGVLQRNADEMITFTETGNSYNLYGTIYFEVRDGTPSLQRASLKVLGYGTFTSTCRRR